MLLLRDLLVPYAKSDMRESLEILTLALKETIFQLQDLHDSLDDITPEIRALEKISDLDRTAENLCDAAYEIRRIYHGKTEN